MAVGGGVQRLVELDEALGGRGGEQLRFVGEVPVRRGGADPRPAGDLPQREPFRPLFLHQLQGSVRQRAFEVAVVIGAALHDSRCFGNLRLDEAC